jgi:hypothetical protein
MAKKNNINTWLIIGAIILVLILANKGYFQGFSFSINPNSENSVTPVTPTPDKVTEFVSYSNILSFSPNPACTGNSVTGSINSNIPNGVCTLFYMGEGWTPYATFDLNANGDVSASRVIAVPGMVRFQATCCDASGNCKISNEVSLTINVCIDSDGDGIPDATDPDDDNDGYSDADEIAAGTNPLNPGSHPSTSNCNSQCMSKGFVSGRGPFASGSSCTGTEVIEYLTGESGLICCCLPTGEGEGEEFGGYASCDAFRAAEGKEFYVTGAGIDNINECEVYAQGYCSQFGSAEPHVFGGIPPGYVTILDFATPDCCIFNCNWSWN